MASGSQNMTTDKARQAFYLEAPHQYGFYTDEYGNFICKNDDPESVVYWHLDNNAKTISSRYYWDTGDLYLYGKLGIGYNPITSGNTYKLYVDGTSYFTNNLTMNGGTITLWGERYNGNYGLDCNNSDIVNINSLRTADNAETYGEGLMFKNGSAWDCMAASGGIFYFRAATDGTPTLNAANSTASLRCNLINNWKFDTVNSLNANDVRTTNGIWACAASITNAAMTNHSVLFGASNVGTPFQLQIPDSSHLYIYKRWYSSGAWSGWTKIYAGYADSSGSCTGNAATASKLTDIVSSDAASSSGTQRYIFISYDNRITNRPAYSTVFTFQTNTSTLFAGRCVDIRGATNATMTSASTNPRICFSENGTQPVYLLYTDYDSYRSPAGLKVVGGTDAVPAWFEVEGNLFVSTNNTTGNGIYLADDGSIVDNNDGYCSMRFSSGVRITTAKNGNSVAITLGSNGNITATRVYNAVWNDYAEFRVADSEEPGRIIIPSSDGIARLSTERLQSGGRIISDTYGSAVGQSDQAKTPIGLAGRALAYPYRNKDEYQIGDAVCSAPGGTVDIMTREEIMTYPDRIVGIVNEIPDYEVWEQTFSEQGRSGQTTQKIEVKGRIWIDIK